MIYLQVMVWAIDGHADKPLIEAFADAVWSAKSVTLKEKGPGPKIRAAVTESTQHVDLGPVGTGD